MKRLTILLSLTFALISCTQAQKKSSKTALKSYSDSASYAIGIDIANNLANNGIDSLLDAQHIAQGIIDGFAKSNLKIDANQAQVVVQGFFMKMQEEAAKKEQQKFTPNIEKGKAYLEENKKKPNVKVTASGLQYEVLKEGSGAKPTATDKVTLHYHGMLIDGTVFDSSVERKEPAQFGVMQVIPGFSEAIQLMSPGAKYRVVIPQEIAYGERGAGAIQPYSTLIFEIELISIDK